MQHRVSATTPMRVGWDDGSKQPTIEVATIHSTDTWLFTYEELVTMLAYIEKLNEG